MDTSHTHRSPRLVLLLPATTALALGACSDNTSTASTGPAAIAAPATG